MPKAHECECEAVTVGPRTPVVEVADQMDAHGIGCVIVVDDEHRPLGIITDRDLTRRVIAAGRDAEKTVAEDVMTSKLIKGSRGDTIEELLDRMTEQSVRRIPLVEDGRLTGLLSLDDLVLELSSQLYNVSESVWVALRETRRSARARRRHEAREDAIEEVRNEIARLGGDVRERALDSLRDVLDRLAGHRD